ncbi:MAG: hypothetical protein AB7H97_19355, partial [Pseudobdellovibrionaceae bacterium]
LTLGNNYFSDSSASSVFALPSNFAALYPNDRNSRTNPNRYWNGRFHLVAVYCQELAAEQIFGAALQTIKYTSHPVPTNLTITPNLLKAHKIYRRVSGSNTAISNPLLQSMATKLDVNDPVGAAAYVTELSEFYNNTLKDFASKMSNREETINVPLNDFSATIIGGVRDDLNFQTLLWDDLIYQADPAQAAVPSDLINDILTSNNHYEALTTQHFDLKKVLVKTTQKLYDGTKSIQNPSPAGLLTSRQWMAAHATAGTNRRLVEYSLKQFLCTPIESAADANGPDNVVGKDIDRFPGGSHSKYTSSCRACHTVLDGFRPAFARFTFSNNFAKHAFLVPSLAPNSNTEDASSGMEQKPSGVAYKYNKNDTVFPGGTEVKNDTWVNNANLGSNSTRFGWSRTNGKGPQDFGRAIAESKRFPSCMAERVFSTICKRSPAEADKTLIQAAATGFSTDHGFNLKYLFQKIGSAPECLGE